MKSERIPESKCVRCGEGLTGATGIGTDGQPHPGALSFCAYCGNLAIFGDDMQLRPLTDGETAQVEADRVLKEMLRVARATTAAFRAMKN